MQERGPTFLDGAGDSPRLPAALHCLSLSLSLAHPGSRNHRFSNWWERIVYYLRFAKFFRAGFRRKSSFFRAIKGKRARILGFPTEDIDFETEMALGGKDNLI